MIGILTRRGVLACATGILALESGCLGASKSNGTTESDTTTKADATTKTKPLTCPGDETMVSCVTDHPKLDLRPTIAPLKREAENQSFVLRNRSRQSVTVNTAGLRVFERRDGSWVERGNENRVMTASIVEPGDAFYWLVKFSTSKDDVLVRDSEVFFPAGEQGQYAVTVEVDVPSGSKRRCGAVFTIEE